MNSKLRPALIAGGITGAISVILNVLATLAQTPGAQPSVGINSAVGCLGCLLTLGSGALAVYFYVAKSTVPAKTGDGAVLGLLAGLTTAVIGALATPIVYALNSETLAQQADQMRQAGLDFGVPALLAFGVVLSLIFTPLIAMLGGLLGVPLFEKRKADAGMPPPPPPGFGGGSPMGGAPTGTPGDFSR